MSIEKLLQNHYQSGLAALDVLENKILHTIAKKERTRRLAGVIIWSVVLVAAISGFIISLSSLAAEFASSGIGELLSTMFSDSSLFAAYGTDFLYSLAESIPVAPLFEGLFMIAVGLVAVRGVVKNENNYFKKLYRLRHI